MPFVESRAAGRPAPHAPADQLTRASCFRTVRTLGAGRSLLQAPRRYARDRALPIVSRMNVGLPRGREAILDFGRVGRVRDFLIR